jgi:hypothetical protein
MTISGNSYNHSCLYSSACVYLDLGCTRTCPRTGTRRWVGHMNQRRRATESMDVIRVMSLRPPHGGQPSCERLVAGGLAGRKPSGERRVSIEQELLNQHQRQVLSTPAPSPRLVFRLARAHYSLRKPRHRSTFRIPPRLKLPDVDIDHFSRMTISRAARTTISQATDCHLHQFPPCCCKLQRVVALLTCSDNL